MTDQQDADQNDKAPTDTEWRVDGSDASSPNVGDGLGDTVVQMPKVTAAKPSMGRGRAPVTRPQSARSQSAKGSAASGPATPAGEAARPAIPKPIKRTQTDDLMSPFEALSTSSAASPAVKPAPAKPASAPGKPVNVAAAAATTAAPSALIAAASVAPAAAAPAASAPKPSVAQPRRTRKARLRVARVDPWSVMKTVFLFSVAFGIMAWVATYVLWQVLLSSGLFDAINDAIVTIISSPNSTDSWRIEDYLSANKVLGVTALLAVINVVISTALGTLGAFLYNLSANILGGLELTLAED